MTTKAIVPYYDQDGITIYRADCADVLPGIDPASVDLLLTDPPYGIGMDTNYANRMHLSGIPRWVDSPVVNDDVPFDPAGLLGFGRCLVFGANYFTDKLPVGSWLVWRKRGMSPVLSDAELAWHNLGGKRVTYFESAHVNTKARDGNLHPTQKPVSLMRWILDKWTEPGDVVLDPYMGSGPVARACLDLGRRYIGVEIEEQYCEAAVNRLGQLSLALQDGDV